MIKELLVQNSSYYQENSSANLQVHRGDGIKFPDLDLAIFCCNIFYSIILIVLCSVNHLKPGKVYRGYSFCY